MASKAAKPVMLWIHGGGNFAGASSDAIFDGETLARRGVVLVSANYRLGVFGFFAHPELTAESPRHASGNYGLMDQVAALKWVHDNITRFGGDPRNVTIFGESAGSLDINVLLTSPLTKGLFARLIGESGPVVAPPSLAEGEKKGLSVAANLKADSLKTLRAMSAEDLQKATGQGLSFLGPLLGVVVDGWVLPKPPFQVFEARQEQRVELLLGSNARELTRPFFPVAGLREGIAAQFGASAPRALKVYGVNDGQDPQPDPVYGSAMAQWATDFQFRCGTVAQLIWHSRAGNTAYRFQFSRVPPGREPVGAAHGSELPYVFGTLSIAARAANAPKYDSVDAIVSDQMQQYWTNFAKSGDPNGGSLPHWPKFDPTARAYLDFTASGPVPRRPAPRSLRLVHREHQERLIMRATQRMPVTQWRYRGIAFVVLTALLVCGSNGTAQPRGGAAPRPSTGSGPYKAVMEMDAGLPDHTIYRPEDLSVLNGANLPLVVWGNGACVNAGNSFSNFLTDISSYGFLVVALGPIVERAAARPAQPGVGIAPAREPAIQQRTDTTQLPRNLPPAATHPSQMIDAIKWATAENDRAGSKYYQHLNTGKIAVMGQSCGGVQAIEVAADTRITTAMVWNSGLFAQPSSMGGGKTIGKKDLESVHVPMAYISGDSTDIAFNNANADFDYIKSIPVFRAWERGVGHGGTYNQPNGGEFAGIGVAWLNWQSKGDQRSAEMFRGADCGLCVNPKWTVQTKNFK